MPGKVTVVGAGFYGSTTAMRLAEYNVFDEVVLTDIVEGKAEGLALDMNQPVRSRVSRPLVVSQTTGLDNSGYEAIAGSDIVVITARPAPQARDEPDGPHRDQREDRASGRGERREARTERRGDRGLQPARRDDPRSRSWPPGSRTTGVIGGPACWTPPVLALRRRNRQESIASVKTLTLGSHGDTMVPGAVTALWTTSRSPEFLSDDEIDELVVPPVTVAPRVVALLKTGSAYAPSAAARMAKAVIGTTARVLPVCAWVDGRVRDRRCLPRRTGEVGREACLGLWRPT